MLEQPTHAIAPGDHVTVTLQFDNGVRLPVSFEVRKPSDGAPP